MPCRRNQTTFKTLQIKPNAAEKTEHMLIIAREMSRKAGDRLAIYFAVRLPKSELSAILEAL
jgi:hypothetical protein